MVIRELSGRQLTFYTGRPSEVSWDMQAVTIEDECGYSAFSAILELHRETKLILSILGKSVSAERTVD